MLTKLEEVISEACRAFFQYSIGDAMENVIIQGGKQDRPHPLSILHWRCAGFVIGDEVFETLEAVRQGIFQYSLGDARFKVDGIKIPPPTPFNTPLEMPFWGARAPVVFGLFSFNTPLEMLGGPAEVAGNPRKLSILHWRCRPKRLQHEPQALLRRLSILHWRCSASLCVSWPLGSAGL